MAEMRQTGADVGYCQAAISSLEEKWDIEKEGEIPRLRTGLGHPTSNPGTDSEVTPRIPHSTAAHHIVLASLLHQNF